MQNEDIGAARNDRERRRSSIDPDLPSLGAVLIGSVLFLTGGMLMLSVIGIPLGILLFAAGLGLMLEPRRTT
jgi:hypothetical protein